MPIQFTTRTIEKELAGWREREQRCYDTSTAGMIGCMTEWLEKAVADRADDQIAHCCHSLGGSYSKRANCLLALERDYQQAKNHYYLAALAYGMCYTLRRAGFRWYVGNAVGPYDFRKNNFNFSKDAVLANAPKEALVIAGEDTVEGMLIQGDYDLARRSLPQDPALIGEALTLCFWAIAHGDQKELDQGLTDRIRTLRRQGAHCPTVIDRWGLAVIRLAQARGMTCGLHVIELPWQLLDDVPADAAGLTLPCEAEVRQIIAEKEKKP